MNTSDEEIRNQIARMWEPGWQTRLQSELAARGYSTVMEFLNTNPRATYSQICEILSKRFAPIQIISCQFAEAKASGMMSHAVKDSLCRCIVEYFPGGWKTDPGSEYKRVSALADWSSEIKVTAHSPELSVVLDCFKTKFYPSEGWIPSGPNDPAIAHILDECWQKHSAYNDVK